MIRLATGHGLNTACSKPNTIAQFDKVGRVCATSQSAGTQGIAVASCPQWVIDVDFSRPGHVCFPPHSDHSASVGWAKARSAELKKETFVSHRFDFTTPPLPSSCAAPPSSQWHPRYRRQNRGPLELFEAARRRDRLAVRRINAHCPVSASAAFATTFSNVSPAEMQPGTSGKLTP
jgi:hypothetical protein